MCGFAGSARHEAGVGNDAYVAGVGNNAYVGGPPAGDGRELAWFSDEPGLGTEQGGFT